ncbi:MAG: helix-turn-helix domain-containing protein [Floccifex sp.]
MTRCERILFDDCCECYRVMTDHESCTKEIKNYKFVGVNSVEIIDYYDRVYIYNGFENRLYRMMSAKDIITDEDFLQDFSNRFKYFKNESKQTYNDISKNTGISLNTLQKYASGSRMPSAIAAIKIANCFHCNGDDLTGL